MPRAPGIETTTGRVWVARENSLFVLSSGQIGEGQEAASADPGTLQVPSLLREFPSVAAETRDEMRNSFRNRASGKKMPPALADQRWLAPLEICQEVRAEP